jgi:hypothetical protein
MSGGKAVTHVVMVGASPTAIGSTVWDIRSARSLRRKNQNRGFANVPALEAGEAAEKRLLSTGELNC